MDVSLPPDLDRQVAKQIESGRYASVSDVVEEGLKLLLETGVEREQRPARLREQIEVGLRELDRGEGLSGPEVFSELDEPIEAARPK